MILVDVHCHLELLEDLDSVILRAKKAGVKVIVANGINPSTNRQNLEISSKYDIVKVAMGIYPPDALTRETGVKQEFDVDKEVEFIKKNKNKIIAIGEVGLDYSTGQDKELQAGVFRKMIRLALELDKPLIVHSRKAEEDVIKILEEEKAKKVVLHCFNGRKSLIKKAIALGYYFSIPTNVVRAENFQLLVKEVNINKLLTETDAPYLSPFKGISNEPAFVIEAVKKIASIKGFNEEEVANNIFMNYRESFG
jgi:TatD DNase family protein